MQILHEDNVSSLFHRLSRLTLHQVKTKMNVINLFWMFVVFSNTAQFFALTIASFGFLFFHRHVLVCISAVLSEGPIHNLIFLITFYFEPQVHRNLCIR